MPKRELNSERQPQIVIANDLRSGTTVFLTAISGWSEQISDALVVTNDDAASNALAVAADDESANKVTGAYLADSNDQGAPLVLRELLRVDGPSINYRPIPDLPVRALNASISKARIQTAPIQSAQGEN